MKLTCDIEKLKSAIINKEQLKQFDKKYKNYPWGTDVFTHEKWTTRQQGTLWRDFTIAGKLLETSPGAIYSILKTNQVTGHLFKKLERVGIDKRSKEVEVEKSLSEFTKEDCKESIPLIREYLEQIINTVYQEEVCINWSKEDNRKLPDYEFSGKPYFRDQTI